MLSLGSTTNYAMKEDAIQVYLPAVTVCMIAVSYSNDSEVEKCVFSYATQEEPDELLLCLSPDFRVLIRSEPRFSQLCANLSYRNRIVPQ